MSQETIYLNNVLTQMKQQTAQGKAVPFSIKVRTYNRYAKTGGKLNHYPEAKLVMKETFNNPNSIKTLRTLKPRQLKERKNPNHFQNKTRNIKLPNGTIKKIHIRCIIEFNNKKVIY